MTKPTKKIILRDSGQEIDQEEFGKIFGGGQKKALNKLLTVKVGEGVLTFKANDLAPVQNAINFLVRENELFRLGYVHIGNDANDRPRYRYMGPPYVPPLAIAPPPPLMLAPPSASKSRNSRTYDATSIAPKQPTETFADYKRRYGREYQRLRTAKKKETTK